MLAQPSQGSRFIRKTDLAPNEYRRNFKQIDDDIIGAITSVEADKVTPLMSKIYLRLLRAPSRYWERAGVLRFEAETTDSGLTKAWTVLCGLTGVSSATLNKAITWMRGQGIIGYFAGKNGTGIRIFINRASASVGTRRPLPNEKILPFPPASSNALAASFGETAFKETFGNPDKSSDIDSSAPESGANSGPAEKASSTTIPDLNIEQVVRRIEFILAPSINAAAARAAAVEHERTREWLEKRGLPKVARVAQREAFNVLRSQSSFAGPTNRARAQLLVGRQYQAPNKPRQLAPDEIDEIAEICVSMLEVRGQTIDATLAEIGSQAGGYLLPEDARRIRELGESLLRQRE
jgi:hypothetical protein